MPLTATVLVNATVPEQVASFGPKRSKVIDPVGEKPPESVAVSLRLPPTVTGPDAWVTTVVSALVGVLADRMGLPHLLFWAITVPYLANAGVWCFFYRCYPRDTAAMEQQLAVSAAPRATGA